MAQTQSSERRVADRFDKVFTVFLSGDRGEAWGVARNISDGGMFVETPEPFPLGSQLWVTFTSPGTRQDMAVLCEVRYQCFINYAGPNGSRTGLRGMGLRFLEVDEREIAPEQKHQLN